MPSVPHTLQLRRERTIRKKNHLSNRLHPIGIGCGLLISLGVAISLIAFTIIYANLTQDLPAIEELSNLFEPTNGALVEPTRLYDRTGEHILLSLEDPAAIGHEYLPVGNKHKKRLPDFLTQATIASTDPHFDDHAGSLWEGVFSSSHPTLAQRLVVDFLLWKEPPGLRRALRERILATQITTRYGRPKILEWYLNSAWYGRYLFGADSAARVYFGKSASDLNLAESAYLAGIAHIPAINPRNSPQTFLEQKDHILQLMFQQGFITSDQLSQALREKPEIQPAAPLPDNPAPSFTQYVLDQLSGIIDFDRLSRGGFKIITSLDYDLQHQSTCAADTQLARISSNPGSTSSYSPSDQECQSSRLLPTFPSESGVSGSSLAANIVVLDPKTGQVLSMVGDPSPGLNPAGLPGHPPGSIFTPFIYLTAFTRGMSPATLLWDIPANSIENPSEFSNPDGKYHGPVRLRTALANDYLLPAVEILNQMGIDQVWQTARQLGLDESVFPDQTDSLRIPFEGGEVSLLELSQAFGSFANQGVLAGLIPPGEDPDGSSSPLQPLSILSVEDYQGQVWINCKSPIGDCRSSSRSVITPQLAFLVNHILSDETARWPSLGHPNPLEIGRPAAVKIGQTIQGKDAWSIGYTPSLVIGTWIGNIDVLSKEKVSINWSTGLWHALMQYAHHERPVEDWSTPVGISELQVCDPSGMLPTPQCQNIVSEVFLSGNEPTVTDTLFQVYQVNRETGRLATLLTPAELIDDRVFMVVPPEALDWAKQSGIPSVPQAYDAIDFSSPAVADLSIVSPQSFASVGGMVPIEGSASGSDFDFYRVQAGQGLNPTRWLQIVDDSYTPVENGRLAIWDTSGLTGLYTLQLMVMNTDKAVQSTLIQVTVDNQAPEIAIRFPEPNQVFRLSTTPSLAFQAEAIDDLENVAVEFLLDGESLGTRTSPPFVTNWSTKPGIHVLKVIATDGADNTAEDQIEFTVQ